MRKAVQMFLMMIVGYSAWSVFEWSQETSRSGVTDGVELKDSLRSVNQNDAGPAVSRLSPEVRLDNMGEREPVAISIGEDIYNPDDPYSYPPQSGSMVNMGSFIDADDPRHLTTIEQDPQSVGEFLDPDNNLDYAKFGDREKMIGEYINADLNNFNDLGSSKVVNLGESIDPDSRLH